MSDTREYRDIDGNVCELGKLVRIEPEWAANQIRHRDRIERELAAARAELADEKAARVYATSAREDVERHIAEAYEALGVTVLESEEGARLPVLIGRLRAELEKVRECEAAALSGQRQLLAKYDGELRELAEARAGLSESLRMHRAHLAPYPEAMARWSKIVGLDAAAQSSSADAPR